MTSRALVLLLALALPLPGGAMEVQRLVVTEHDGAYSVELEAVLDAPASGVIAVLTDYARYPSLDPRIAEARVIGESDGLPLLFTRLRGCLGSWLCRDMDRYERITQGDGLLVAESVPGRGDLESGRAVTSFEPRGHATYVRYRTDFRPSFWMPRFLVRGAMLRTLESATREMFTNVESRARRGDHP